MAGNAEHVGVKGMTRRILVERVIMGTFVLRETFSWVSWGMEIVICLNRI
jgi:hypothetical protein